MTVAEELGGFAASAELDRASPRTREQLRVRVLDSLGCAVGALGAGPPQIVRGLIEELGGSPRSSLVGGGRTAPDRAALHNGTLVRYLDFNDSYLAPGETCHPSDNLAAVLAAAQYADAPGSEMLAALAVSYQVQCRLSAEAPVRGRGFDHTTQGAYAAAAGASRALGLDADRTANAVAIAGTALNALRVTRTGELSNWKGLAFPYAACGAVQAALLASHGITGPREVFEGNKGFMDAIAGEFEIEWGAEGLDAVERTVLKRFNAEVHSQSAIEALLELRDQHAVRADAVERIELDTFDVAHDIIGGGEEGAKTLVRSKEEADHSLPYILAVAMLDGEVMPSQYDGERIGRRDVQELLTRVSVRPDPELSARFPEEHACILRLQLRDGTTLERRKNDYEGFHARPMSWEAVTEKFDSLAEDRLDPGLRQELLDAVRELERIRVAELGELLERCT